MSYDPNLYVPNGQQPVWTPQPIQYVLPTMSVVIHAHSKIGKSTLACTAPPPLVVFDAEGSSKFLPMRVIPWDPKVHAPPMWDGQWEAANVVVNNFEDLVYGLQHLETGQHHFRTVVLDSISEIQRKLKDKIEPGMEGSKWKQDHWGELLRRMDALLRGVRDLTQHPTNPLQMAVFVAESRINEEGRWAPSMEGGIRTALPYFFDLICYLQVVNYQNPDGSFAIDEHGEPYEVRQVFTRPTNPLYYAGERIQRRVPAVLSGMPTTVAPANMWEATPHLTRDVLWRVFPQLVPQTTQTS